MSTLPIVGFAQHKTFRKTKNVEIVLCFFTAPRLVLQEEAHSVSLYEIWMYSSHYVSYSFTVFLKYLATICSHERHHHSETCGQDYERKYKLFCKRKSCTRNGCLAYKKEMRGVATSLAPKMTFREGTLGGEHIRKFSPLCWQCVISHAKLCVIYIFKCLSAVCLSVCLSFGLSVHLHACMYVCLSLTHSLVHLSVYWLSHIHNNVFLLS